MWRSVHRTWLCLLSAFFCLGFAGTAQGATPQDTPGVTDLIRDRQDRLLEEQQRRSGKKGDGLIFLHCPVLKASTVEEPNMPMGK
jgi:hypothetical protein